MAQSKKTGNPASDKVRTRLVLNFPGFEQTDSTAQLGRMLYSAEHTGKVWGFSTKQKSLKPAKNQHHTIAEHETKGANWKTQTRVVQFRWNDIVHTYEKESFPFGFIKNLKKYSEFFLDGTVGKYRKASLRYWGFTLFPVMLALIFAIISWFVSGFLLSNFELGSTAALILQLLSSFLLTLLACKWPGDRLYIPLTVADWGFARDMVHQSNSEIESRFLEFGEIIANEINTSKHDEIVIVGHSFGSLWAIAGLSLALQKNPKLLTGKQIGFLSLGSSILKIALSPEAEFMRQHWQNIMDQSNLFWHEIQSKDDWIGFYKCDPFEQVALENTKASYKIDRIRFSKGVEKSRYITIKRSPYRTHRQYILYYDNRIDYDYMLRLFGPIALKSLANGKPLTERIDNSGALV